MYMRYTNRRILYFTFHSVRVYVPDDRLLLALMECSFCHLTVNWNVSWVKFAVLLNVMMLRCQLRGVPWTMVTSIFSTSEKSYTSGMASCLVELRESKWVCNFIWV